MARKRLLCWILRLNCSEKNAANKPRSSRFKKRPPPESSQDSGFEVDALGGEPGVRSARFLGPAATYDARFAEIYRRLAGRRAEARFVTALAVATGDTILFETETVIEGIVAEGARGEHGFGYDPIFWYPPFGRTTAELTDPEKATVSHRGRAFRDFRRWLKTSHGQ